MLAFNKLSFFISVDAATAASTRNFATQNFESGGSRRGSESGGSRRGSESGDFTSSQSAGSPLNNSSSRPT